MKMVKSLLLAGAAGLVASAGAQAADLPVKAKPVEYVKVCSLYGAGFYYIPGTDICMKIGGYVRYQLNTGTASITAGPYTGGNTGNNRLNPTGDAVHQRVRAIATFDTRQQTAYGTLRTYLLMGYTQDSTANAGQTAVAGDNTRVYMTRAFIQIAGFTFGKATSFFDFVSTAAVAYNAGYTHTPDTGDGGYLVGAYTAQLGNGVSASISIEQSRRSNTTYMPGSALFNVAGLADQLAPSGASAVAFGGNNQQAQLPDLVGNIRIDQAWGSAQVSAAAHDVSAGYYGLGPGTLTSANLFSTAPAFNEANGHPGRKWGWAVSPGVRINTPMVGPGDYFQAAAVFSQGAVQYASKTPGGGNFMNGFSGNTIAYGHAWDASFSGNAAGGTAVGTSNQFGNGINLTTAFSMFASYEHFWTPSLRTSVYGSYLNVTQNDSAKSQYCATLAANAPATSTGVGGLNCSPNWSTWDVGSRSQWNITKDFYVGVDVIYTKFITSNGGNGVGNNNIFVAAGFAGGHPAGIYQYGNLDQVSVTWRVHRDIVP